MMPFVHRLAGFRRDSHKFKFYAHLIQTTEWIDFVAVVVGIFCWHRFYLAFRFFLILSQSRGIITIIIYYKAAKDTHTDARSLVDHFSLFTWPLLRQLNEIPINFVVVWLFQLVKFGLQNCYIHRHGRNRWWRLSVWYKRVYACTYHLSNQSTRHVYIHSGSLYTVNGINANA